MSETIRSTGTAMRSTSSVGSAFVLFSNVTKMLPLLCRQQICPQQIPYRIGFPPRTVDHMTETSSFPSIFDDQLSMRLLRQRVVVLGSEVTDESANRVCAQLLLLSAEDPRADISLYINSPGGSVTAGFAVYDTMRMIPTDVSTLAMGFSASMGQFLLCGGTKGKRYALPNARILMHQGSAGIGGTAMDIEIQAENLEFTKHQIMSLIAQNTGQTLETVLHDSERDRWFTAEQAREYGMVDQVVEKLDDVRPAGSRRKAGL